MSKSTVFATLRFLVLGPLGLVGSVFAAEPAWWRDSVNDTAIIESGATEDNYAPANIGQLKHVATKADRYLDLTLPGGSGGGIDSVVSGLSVGVSEGNYAPANLGQVKAVAEPFFRRLASAGYDVRAGLVERGYPSSWQYDRPWSPQTPTYENYAPANIGQLKLVFSFSLEGFKVLTLEDSDTDGLPDWWENANLAGGIANLPGGDADGNGINNVTELLFVSLNWSASGFVEEFELKVFSKMQ